MTEVADVVAAEAVEESRDPQAEVGNARPAGTVAAANALQVAAVKDRHNLTAVGERVPLVP